jgi:hypothetical protein
MVFGTLDHCFVSAPYYCVKLQLRYLLVHYDVLFTKTKYHTHSDFTFPAPVTSSRSHPTSGGHLTMNRWNLSFVTLVLAVLGFTTILEKGWLRHFPICSVRFLTKRGLKSWWEYWVSHADRRIYFVSSVPGNGKKFCCPLEGIATHWIIVGFLILFINNTPDVSYSVLQCMALRYFFQPSTCPPPPNTHTHTVAVNFLWFLLVCHPISVFVWSRGASYWLGHTGPHTFIFLVFLSLCGWGKSCP